MSRKKIDNCFEKLSNALLKSAIGTSNSCGEKPIVGGVRRSLSQAYPPYGHRMQGQSAKVPLLKRQDPPWL